MKRTFLPIYIPLSLLLKSLLQKGLKRNRLVEKISVEQLLQELENTSFSISEQPYGSLFDLFHREFLQQSVSKQLIHPDSLALAGDGTPFVTSARERKHRVCDCSSKGINDCSCDRYFSQPDCDFPSLIVTSDGIPPVPVFIMDTIYICWLLRIQKATFRFSLY